MIKISIKTKRFNLFNSDPTSPQDHDENIDKNDVLKNNNNPEKNLNIDTESQQEIFSLESKIIDIDLESPNSDLTSKDSKKDNSKDKIFYIRFFEFLNSKNEKLSFLALVIGASVACVVIFWFLYRLIVQRKLY